MVVESVVNRVKALQSKWIPSCLQVLFIYSVIGLSSFSALFDTQDNLVEISIQVFDNIVMLFKPHDSTIKDLAYTKDDGLAQKYFHY